MAITSGFFDSVDGDRTYDAEQMTNYFEGLVSDGIYQTIGDALIVRATGEGLNVTIGSGRGLVKTHWIKNDAPITLTLSAANVQYARIDSIFMRWDSAARTVDIVVGEGLPSPQPQTPQPTRTEAVWDLLLATVRVEKNVSVLSQSTIHDNRGSSSCPWITGLIRQVDTSQLFLQFQTAYEEQFKAFDNYIAQKEAEFESYTSQKQADFDTWFADLTGKLQVDTTLHEYRNTYPITADQEASRLYPVGIPEYVHGEDILFVTVDGVALTENVDFKVLKFDEHYPDVDGNGRVTSADASLISSAYAKISTGLSSGLTDAQEKAADANFNGEIDSNDAGLVSAFYSAVSTGVYPDDTLESWAEFFGDRRGTTINPTDYYIVPLLSTAYREGSRMTIRTIKSVIGQGSAGATPKTAAVVTSGVVGVVGDATQVEEV